MPTVSVIIPLFQGARTIRRAVDSVLAQDVHSLEIIVSDDGSTDGGLEVVRSAYRDEPRLILLGPHENGGPSIARNRAIEAASGQWLALLDADDSWRPNRLSAMLAFAGDADFIVDELVGYDAVADMETGPLHSSLGAPELNLTQLLNQEVAGRPFSPGLLKPLMLRSFLLRTGLRYNTDVRHGEDILLYAEALMLGACIKVCPSPLYVYTTPYGVRSGRRSPHTKSGRNGKLIAKKLRELGNAHRNALSITELSRLDHRVCEFEDIEGWWKLEAAWRSRHWARSAALVAGEPYIRKRLMRGAKRRLFGRSWWDRTD
jgi:succinoglycan biosynthesis protein ExoO